MILLWNRVLLAATTAPTRHGWFAPLFILLATAVVTGAYAHAPVS